MVFDLYQKASLFDLNQKLDLNMSQMQALSYITTKAKFIISR